MTTHSPAVVWFRRDLRLHDHAALTAAVSSHDKVVCLFVLDERLLSGRGSSPNRAWFLKESLTALANEIASRGGELVVVRGRPEQTVVSVAKSVDASTVFISRDYSPFGRNRDQMARRALNQLGIGLEEFPGLLAVEPEDVTHPNGGAFSVFGAFYRRWAQVARRPVAPAPGRIATAVTPFSSELQDWRPERPDGTLLSGGESSALKRLDNWARDGLENYSRDRDRLDLEGTSRLSQDLRFGLVSPNQVLALAENCDDPKFVQEVAWREFYTHLAWHRPRVLRSPFRAEYAGLPWREDGESLAAWEGGRTGFPVVDAAMRQLVATGWMHNRARMVAASFLTKNLFIDYRNGERFFMRHLVDGDVAVNNGGWQWASSTGTDAQPYFRVFNPVLQGERFDPDGTYVRRWVPELSRVPLRFLHKPWTMPDEVQSASGCLVGRDYPSPIVAPEGAVERARAFFARAGER